MVAVSKYCENQLKQLINSQNSIVDVRFSEFNDGYIVSNDFCDFAFLTNIEFNNLLFKRYSPLQIRKIEDKIHLYRQLHACNCFSTVLNIFIAGLDCPLQCVYCQADAGVSRCNSIMNEETASFAIDFAMQSPSKFLQIEFQGGEPLSNFSIVKYVVINFLKRAKDYDKQIEFSLVTSLFGMTEEKLSFIQKYNISI